MLDSNTFNLKLLNHTLFGKMTSKMFRWRKTTFLLRKMLYIVTVTINKEYIIVKVTIFKEYLIVTVTILQKNLIVTLKSWVDPA